MDPECKLKSPKSTVKKIIEGKESHKEQAHFTPTSPRKRKKNGSSLDLWMIITNSQMQEYMKSAAALLNLPTIIRRKQLWFIWKKDKRWQVPCFYYMYIIKKGLKGSKRNHEK